MEPPSSGRIGVINHSGRRLSTASLQRAAEAAFASSLPHGDVCILLTGDEEIRALNSQFRDIDEPTDVLTFPAAISMNTEVASMLGDIAISVPYAERQASLRGVPLAVELQFLAIHGALHLLGWDDETEPDRARMMAEMNRVGQLLGLPADDEWTSLLHGEPA